MRVPIKEMNDGNSDLSRNLISGELEYFDALRNAAIREAPVAQDLTKLLNCLPNSSNLRVFNCISGSIIGTIMPIAVKNQKKIMRNFVGVFEKKAIKVVRDSILNSDF